jgi:hypothetical protein
MRYRSIAVAMLLNLLTVTAALADKLSEPIEAVETVAKFCIDTGAKADKLEAVLAPLRLIRDDIRVEQHGNIISMQLRLDANQRLDINYVRGGDVLMCTYRTYLENAPATFELAKKRFDLQRSFVDYETISGTAEQITSPLGSALQALVSLHKMPADNTGSLTLVVLLAPSTN